MLLGVRIVIAPDSFKGSLSADRAAAAIAGGVARAVPDAELVLRPVADGGEGTVAAALRAGYAPRGVRVSGQRSCGAKAGHSGCACPCLT